MLNPEQEYRENFVTQFDDQDVAQTEAFVSWYQSMNRSMDNAESASNILGSLYFLAELYLRADLPSYVIDVVARHAGKTFLELLAQCNSITVVDLQLPVSFYIRAGSFDDAFVFVDRIIEILRVKISFPTADDGNEFFASLEETLKAPIRSRITRVNETLDILYSLRTTNYSNSCVNEDSLTAARLSAGSLIMSGRSYIMSAI